MRQWQLGLVLVGGLIAGIANLARIHQDQVGRLGTIKVDDFPTDVPGDAGSQQNLSPSDSFGACLMMKEDNSLLYEWIAYHYTIMPLRYLVIGSDEGNREDPRTVLQRWNGTGLKYWVLEASEFVGRHGLKNRGPNDPDEHHHAFLYRQRGFITTCAELMKEQNMSWVLYTDSDEFVVINRFGGEDDTQEFHQRSRPDNETSTTLYNMRKSLSEWKQQDFTVLEALRRLEKDVQEPDTCVLMPRLRFGALENVTCEGESTAVADMARHDYHYSHMSTLRYKIHAGTMNFPANKFGKVMVDLSRLTGDQVREWPKNIHRPFKPACPRPVVWYAEAVFALNHYTASWERYSSRHDLRRTCQAWMKMAYFQEGNSCHQRIHEWFPRFVKQMGKRRAQYLLGVDILDDQEASEMCPPKTD